MYNLYKVCKNYQKTHLVIGGSPLQPDFLAHALGKVPKALVVLLLSRLPCRVRGAPSPLGIATVLGVERDVATLPAPPQSLGSAGSGGVGRGVGGLGYLLLGRRGRLHLGKVTTGCARLEKLCMYMYVRIRLLLYSCSMYLKAAKCLASIVTQARCSRACSHREKSGNKGLEGVCM